MTFGHVVDDVKKLGAGEGGEYEAKPGNKR